MSINHLDEIQRKAVAAMKATGEFTTKEISEKYNITCKDVHNLYRRWVNKMEKEKDIPISEAIPVGLPEWNALYKLNEEQKKEIERLESCNKSLAENVSVLKGTITGLNCDLETLTETYEAYKTQTVNQNALLINTNKMLSQENEKLECFIESEKIDYSQDSVKEFAKITKRMIELYRIKNIKYGDSYSKTYKEYGKSIICVRLDDKLSRLKQIILNGIEDTEDETVLDTLMDLANYAVMGIKELEA